MQTNTIIIPCYNEAGRLKPGLMHEFLIAQPDVSLVLVNDGSSDSTSVLLHEFQKQHPERIFVVDLASNLGKGNAIRQGILFALDRIQPACIGYMDADFSAPFGEMDKLFQYLSQHSHIGVVFGSRVKRMGSKIERTLVRHYLGRIFATCVSLMLKLPVYDSQCGAKVMKTATANVLFKEAFITNWLFDVELLFRYKIFFGIEKTLREVYEFPLYQWKESKGSKIRLKHVLSIPFNMVKIYLHYSKVLRNGDYCK